MTGLLDLPDPKGIAELISKVRAGDAAWLRGRYEAGGLVWLRDRLPAGVYDELGARLERGDVAWLRTQLGTVQLPGFDVFRSAATTGAASAVARTRTSARRPWWQWAIPLLAVVALAALALATCGGNDDGATGDTTAVAADATTAAAETTVVAAETTAPASSATTTALATTAPPTTAPATTAPGTTLGSTAPPAPSDPATTNAAGDPTPENLTVYFDSSSARITVAERARLAGAIAVLRALPAGTKVIVVGHADRSGSAAANRVLSRARAAAVVAVLRAGLGADASKVTFSIGAKGDTESVKDLAKSRRVTIEIQR